MADQKHAQGYCWGARDHAGSHAGWGHRRHGRRRWAALMAWQLMASRRRRWMAAQPSGGEARRGRPQGPVPGERPAYVSLPQRGDVTWI
ncbi:MAG: hypothetical protein M3O87_03635 [Candidatus Dormibacteraeota bacterium]|nr:hypothetical protein [Candidatus Dormibacteraeota bacterium]